MSKPALNLIKLNNKEFSRLIVSLLRDWQASKVTVEDTVLTKLKTRLSQQSDLFAQGLSQVKDSNAAKDLEAADKLRDQHLQLLADTVKLGRYAPTTEEKEAYKALSPLFKNLTKVKQSGYEEESASINGILEQLKASEHQAYVKSLNLTKSMQLLTKSQADFEALLLKRHTTKTTKVVYDNKTARKNLQETYLLLVDYLHVMAKEQGTVAYTKLYKILVTNSDFFKPLTLSRKAKDKVEEPEKTGEQASPSLPSP